MSQDGNTARAGEKRLNEGKAWSVEEERRLHGAFWALRDVRDLSAHHARTSGAIRSRLKRLGLVDEAGAIVRPKPGFCPTARRSPGVSLRDRDITPATTSHCDDAQLLDLFYRLSMGQRGAVLSHIRRLVALLDRD